MQERVCEYFRIVGGSIWLRLRWFSSPVVVTTKLDVGFLLSSRHGVLNETFIALKS